MSKDIAYCRKTGEVGIHRLATKKEEEEFHVNYVVDILDPIYMTYTKRKVRAFGDSDHDWVKLPHTDTRYQFANLFYILEEGVADWCIDVNSGDGRFEIEGQEITNPHHVFKLIKGLFT